MLLTLNNNKGSACKIVHMNMSFSCMSIFLLIKVIFIWMVSHKDSFWNCRSKRQLGNGLCNTDENTFQNDYHKEIFKEILKEIFKVETSTHVRHAIIWLCDRAMRFQSKTHISPLLAIESPVAQRLEHPTRSRRVVGSNPIWNSDFFPSWCLYLENFFQNDYHLFY